MQLIKSNILETMSSEFHIIQNIKFDVKSAKTNNYYFKKF